MNACFPAGTPIHTNQGLRNIEDIQIGDTVIAYDEIQKDTILSRVTNTFSKSWQKMVRIVAGGDTITATNNHPIYTDPKVFWAKPKSTLIGISRLKFLGKAQNTLLSGYLPQLGKYLRADSLRQNMKLLALTGALLTVHAVEAFDTTLQVYNFEVAEYHNYFVGEEGVLVHNDCAFIKAGIQGENPDGTIFNRFDEAFADNPSREFLKNKFRQDLDALNLLDEADEAAVQNFFRAVDIEGDILTVQAQIERVRAWEVLRGSSHSTDLAWLGQMDRWLGLNVTYTRTNDIVTFTAPNGMQFARLDGDNLYYLYPGFGGDILVKTDRVTTVLGKFQEIFGDPNSLGTWIYLQRNEGLPDGIISRVVSGNPPNNSIAFLDLPAEQYNSLLNQHIRNEILNSPLFDGNTSNLDLITIQDPWGAELETLIQNQILPNASTDEITDILTIGRNNGNEDFWITYNDSFLEAAFQRGDDVRLVSDPTPGSSTRTGTYARELDRIEDPNTGLMYQYNYQYNPSTKTYEKQ